MAIAITLHLFGVLLWVGGMLFVHFQLRPAVAEVLDPPQRLRLWVSLFGRFFPLVWVAILTILGTGLWAVFAVFGGFSRISPAIHLMLGSGFIMLGVFAYIFFAPFQHLRIAVADQDWSTGGRAMGRIRVLMNTNLIFGLVNTALGVMSRYIAI